MFMFYIDIINVCPITLGFWKKILIILMWQILNLVCQCIVKCRPYSSTFMWLYLVCTCLHINQTLHQNSVCCLCRYACSIPQTQHSACVSYTVKSQLGKSDNMKENKSTF